MGSFEASFQEKEFKLSWVSIAIKMGLGAKILLISSNLALHLCCERQLVPVTRLLSVHTKYVMFNFFKSFLFKGESLGRPFKVHWRS